MPLAALAHPPSLPPSFPPSRPPFSLPQDYAKLTDEEMAATEGAGRTEPDKAHTTFVPPSHPFAHARLLNVVVGRGEREGGREGKGEGGLSTPVSVIL